MYLFDDLFHSNFCHTITSDRYWDTNPKENVRLATDQLKKMVSHPPDGMKSLAKVGPFSPIFNKIHYGVELGILPGLKAFWVVQYKSIVIIGTKSNIDIGLSWAIVRDELSRNSQHQDDLKTILALTAFSTPKTLLINDDFPHPVYSKIVVWLINNDHGKRKTRPFPAPICETYGDR